MLVHVDHPIWAIAAALLLGAGMLGAGVLRRQSFRWRLAGILLPAGAAACVGLALSGMAVAGRGEAVIVLDFSPSARNAAWRDPDWVRQLARRQLGETQQIAIWGDDGVQRRILLSETTPATLWPARFAWDAAPAVGPAPVSRPQWWITDGLFPAPENPPAAVTIVRPAEADVAVCDLIARNASGADGAPVEILVRVRAVAGGATRAGAKLRLERDGVEIGAASPEFSSPAGVQLDASRWITFHETLSPDDKKWPHRYTATVTLTPQSDAWPENDRGSVVWAPSGGGQQVLTVSNRMAAGPGVVRPESFLARASELAAEGWQAVILDDLPAIEAESADGRKVAALSAEGTAALDRLVRETGAGLLIASRENAFGTGHYGEAKGAAEILENLSPVWSRPHEGPGQSVVFLLDASASMNDAAGGEKKFALLARAVEDAARFLAAGDHVSVITFNRQGQLLARGAAAEVVPGLSGRLQAVAPQGETVPDAAMDLLTGTLGMPDFRGATVVFLTDGEIPSMDVARWKQAVGAAPMVIVAPRSQAGRDSALDRLGSSGIDARWLAAPDPASWRTLLPELVLEKTRGALHHEALAWRAGAAGGIAGSAASWIQTWRKPESLLMAQGPRGQPVAAIAQRGLGQVAAVMIPDDSSPAWTALQAQVLQRILAPAGDRRFHAAAERQAEGDWRVTADGVDGVTFLDRETLSVRTVGTDDTQAMKQTAPGHYEARVPAARGLSAVITRKAGGTDQLVARVQTSDVQSREFPASVETPWRPANTRGLAVLSAEARDATRWDVPREWFSLVPAMWLAAAALAVAAVWLRM